MLKRLSSVVVAVVASGVASAASMVLPQASLVPGGVLVLPVEGDAGQIPVVTYDDRRAMVLRQDDHWVAVVGIPLSAHLGRALVRVHAAGKPETEVPFEVLDKKYVTQSLKVAPSKVDLSKKDLDRVNHERPRIEKALGTFSFNPPATLRLLQPAHFQQRAAQSAHRHGYRRPHGNADQGTCGWRRDQHGQLLLQRQHRVHRSR